MIVTFPDPVLRSKCAQVASGVDVSKLVQRLREAMDWSEKNGRPAGGLAAPQIGATLRVFVHSSFPHAFVNPRVLKTAGENVVALEGCLSLPAIVIAAVSRPKWVKLTCEDEDRRVHTYKLHGRDARVALHELDHLDGVLITDKAVG